MTTEEIDIKQLLDAGSHFGHLSYRWNPKMKSYILMERNGVHIFDLRKTKTHLLKALSIVETYIADGKTLLFVGTKKQTKDIIENEAQRCNMPYVTYRWLGGMLTNFSTIRRSISRIFSIESMKKGEDYDLLTKKEKAMLDREKDRLNQYFDGISSMTRLPDIVFVVDVRHERIAIQEANRLNIPIVALVDSNCDPDVADHIIPCNDDSTKTIRLISTMMADAVLRGLSKFELRTQAMIIEESKNVVREVESKKNMASKMGRKRKRKTSGGTSTTSEKAQTKIENNK